MIKNIVFDLGNVILKGNPAIVLDTFNLNPTLYNDIKNTFFSNLEILDKGLISLEDFYNQCKFNTQISDDIREKLIRYYKYRPMNNDMIKVIENLKRNGYNIYILSNNNRETSEYIKQLPFFNNISGFIFSCDYNVVKPNPEIYKLLFKKYNLIPEECYFIDDSTINIDASKKLKMDGYVFDNNLINLENELQSRNIDIY